MIEAGYRFYMGMRDESSHNHWRELGLNHDFSKRKTLFIIPGNGVNSAKEANGMCKAIGNMLPKRITDNLDICCIYFPQKCEHRQYAVDRAMFLLDYVILPLVSKKDEHDDLQKIPVPEAAKHLRNFPIVTHCYGSYMMETLDKELAKSLQNIGYSREEQEFIQRQLMVFQNNNISRNVGDITLNSTNLMRITKSDEKAQTYKYPLDSFQQYVQNELLNEDEVLYVKTGKNERVLLVPKINEAKGDEHNGAYWMEAQKTPAGELENKIFSSILAESVSTDYFIENLEQVIRNIAARRTDFKEDMTDVVEYGKEYGDDFFDYRNNIRGRNFKVRDKILAGTFTAEDIKNITPEVLLVADDSKSTLLDYAVKSGDAKAVAVIWGNIQKVLPKRNAALEESFAAFPQDYTDAKEKQQRYMQQALDNSDVDMFKALSKGFSGMSELNYENADDNMIMVAAGMYGKAPAAMTQLGEVMYFKNLVYIRSRLEKMPQSQQVVDAMAGVDDKIFSKENSKKMALKYKIKSYCRKFETRELMNKCLSRWGETTPNEKILFSKSDYCK